MDSCAFRYIDAEEGVDMTSGGHIHAATPYYDDADWVPVSGQRAYGTSFTPQARPGTDLDAPRRMGACVSYRWPVA